MRPWHRIQDDDTDHERCDLEQSPLLGASKQPCSSSSSSSSSSPSSSPSPSWLPGAAESTSLTAAAASASSDHGAASSRTTPTVLITTLAASLLILTIDVVASVPMTPRLVLFEQIICRQYYSTISEQHDPSSSSFSSFTSFSSSFSAPLGDCKIEPVQSELAIINGWKETFDTIPGVLVSIPYGALANYIGRPNVMKLALFGSLLSECWIALVCWLPHRIPLRAIWLSGIFQLIGGGGATVISMGYTMIADLCTPQQLTTTFSQVHAAVLLSEMLSIPLGSALVSLDPWIPVLGSLVVLAAVVVILILFSARCFPSLPPTRKFPDDDIRHRRRDSLPLSITDASDAQYPSGGGGGGGGGQGRRRISSLPGFCHRLHRAAAQSALGRLWLSSSVLLMFVAFFCCQLSRQFSSVLLQFSSFKLNWDYAKASYLLPLRAAINLAVLFILIPRLLHYLTHTRGLATWRANKLVTLLSGICLVVGSLVLFLAASAAVLIQGQAIVGLGFAFTVTARSFLTAMVEPRYTSLLFTSVTAVTYAGLIVGGPVFAGAFQAGLRVGGLWLGLPFLIAAGLFALATLVTAAATVGEDRAAAAAGGDESSSDVTAECLT